ncbi:MAG: hypothetical protein OES24_18025, partial [Acidimicrobiia bacterium]|nr:hypothetical protein [Acidimicrobiia bacterium]
MTGPPEDPVEGARLARRLRLDQHQRTEVEFPVPARSPDQVGVDGDASGFASVEFAAAEQDRGPLVGRR